MLGGIHIIENKSVARNEEYDKFIEKENFVCINAGVYKKIEYPTDLDVIEIHLSKKNLNSLINLTKYLKIGLFIIKVSTKLSNSTLFTINKIASINKSAKISLIIVSKQYSKNINFNLILNIPNINAVYVPSDFMIPKLDNSSIYFFKKNLKVESTNNIINFFPMKRELIESEYFNTYINKRIAIDELGKIKLSSTYDTVIGNINIINIDNFHKFIKRKFVNERWGLKKIFIDVCMDCEFKKSCTDFREPFKRKTENEWYHKTECNYNPYIAKWKGEEGYRTLAECGVISNHEEFSIDHEKIAAINEELWGEE